MIQRIDMVQLTPFAALTRSRERTDERSRRFTPRYGLVVLVGIGHVDLVCRDLDASLAFYAAVFGAARDPKRPRSSTASAASQINYLRFPRPLSGSLGLRQAQESKRLSCTRPASTTSR